MILPEGGEILWRGWYIDVAQPERLVIAFADRDIVGRAAATSPTSSTSRPRRGTGIFMDTMADLLARSQ